MGGVKGYERPEVADQRARGAATQVVRLVRTVDSLDSLEQRSTEHRKGTPIEGRSVSLMLIGVAGAWDCTSVNFEMHETDDGEEKT